MEGCPVCAGKRRCWHRGFGAGAKRASPNGRRLRAWGSGARPGAGSNKGVYSGLCAARGATDGGVVAGRVDNDGAAYLIARRDVFLRGQCSECALVRNARSGGGPLQYKTDVSKWPIAVE